LKKKKLLSSESRKSKRGGIKKRCPEKKRKKKKKKACEKIVAKALQHPWGKQPRLRWEEKKKNNLRGRLFGGTAREKGGFHTPKEREQKGRPHQRGGAQQIWGKKGEKKKAAVPQF